VSVVVVCVWTTPWKRKRKVMTERKMKQLCRSPPIWVGAERRRGDDADARLRASPPLRRAVGTPRRLGTIAAVVFCATLFTCPSLTHGRDLTKKQSESVGVINADDTDTTTPGSNRSWPTRPPPIPVDPTLPPPIFPTTTEKPAPALPNLPIPGFPVRHTTPPPPRAPSLPPPPLPHTHTHTHAHPVSLALS
jgi:hypothetical protein